MSAHHSTDMIFHAWSSEQHLPESAPCGLIIHYANAGQLQAAYKDVSQNGGSQMLARLTCRQRVAAAPTLFPTVPVDSSAARICKRGSRMSLISSLLSGARCRLRRLQYAT